MMPNLIVPVLNRYDLLERMMRTIDYPIRDLLIIDNGGGFVVTEKPALVETLTVLQMPANLGIAPSWNLGIKSFPFDDVFYFTSNDVMFEPGTLQKLHEQAMRTDVTICADWPHWQTFAVGDRVVESAGLFDEAIFPMNWEDDEYQWRVEKHGFSVVKLDLPMFHDGHQTFRSDEHYARRNTDTYKSNEAYFRLKQSVDDISAGEWSLTRRRENKWEV